MICLSKLICLTKSKFSKNVEKKKQELLARTKLEWHLNGTEGFNPVKQIKKAN